VQKLIERQVKGHREMRVSEIKAKAALEEGMNKNLNISKNIVGIQMKKMLTANHLLNEVMNEFDHQMK
jgi:hypothetical protein